MGVVSALSDPLICLVSLAGVSTGGRKKGEREVAPPGHPGGGGGACRLVEAAVSERRKVGRSPAAVPSSTSSSAHRQQVRRGGQGRRCLDLAVPCRGRIHLHRLSPTSQLSSRATVVSPTASLFGSIDSLPHNMARGNILLDRDETQDKNHTMGFTIEGKKMCTRTLGLNVSILDFTLSRINTGDAILLLDLSADPALFEGPKRDKQAGTYRKMKQITNDYWEGSLPKTNAVWLIYLLDIVLQKRYCTFTSKDDRELRAFKKRLAKYDSARDRFTDSFFSDLLSEEGLQPSALPLL